MIIDDRKLANKNWGPYSKHYSGLSYIPKLGDCTMFDFIPLIGRVRSKVIIPDVNFESDYHMIRSNEDADVFTYRYEIQWKDKEYVDISFFPASEDAYLCRAVFVNNTKLKKEYAFSLMSNIQDEDKSILCLNKGDSFIPSSSYLSIEHISDSSWIDGQNYELDSNKNKFIMGRDGFRKGVTVASYLVNGSGLGNVVLTKATTTQSNRSFVFTKGSSIFYACQNKGNLFLRYAAFGFAKMIISVKSNNSENEIEIFPTSSSGAFDFNCIKTMFIGRIEEDFELSVVDIIGLSDSPYMVIDGFIVTKGQEVGGKVKLKKALNSFKINREIGRQGVLYETTDGHYIAIKSNAERNYPPFPYSDCSITNVLNGELSGQKILRKLSNDSLFNWYNENSIIYGDNENIYSGYNIGPIVVDSLSQKVVYVSIAIGKTKDISKESDYVLNSYSDIITKCDKLLDKSEAKVVCSKYHFSQTMLKNYIFTNLTYPVRINDENLITYTPGKRWGGLFTWDSGMHALGLVSYEPYKALQIIKQYFPLDNDDVDAVLHGSPLPLHLYVLDDFFNRTNDLKVIRDLYQKAKRYYSYFAGISVNSTFNFSNQLLLNPYYDGYNSIGLDDYPIQHFEGVEGLYGDISTPSAMTHAIVCAKIMQKFAILLNEANDIDFYENYATKLIKNLNAYYWDEESGYYSHLQISTLKQVRTPEGENFNKGIDGLIPLLIDLCPKDRVESMLNNLFSKEGLWTDFGITSVAKNASYRRNDGYWNGKVWVPYQYFFWKALIGKGLFKKAKKIAFAILEAWRNSTDELYYCYEQFDASTGMGEGCHHFAGLSAPLASIYNAYFRPFEVTVGYEGCIYKRERFDNRAVFYISFCSSQRENGVLFALEKEKIYEIYIDDKYVCSVNNGIFEIKTEKKEIKVEIIKNEYDK